MKKLNKPIIEDLIRTSSLSKRLQKQLIIGSIDIDWDSLELLFITSKTAQHGLFIYESENSLKTLAFELKKRIQDTRSGKYKPIICDFCYTWLPGEQAAYIRFGDTNFKSFGFYICALLNCNLNVRGVTEQSMRSKIQLGETIDVESRIIRLKRNIENITNTVLQVQAK